MPGVVVEEGAVVQRALVADGIRIGKGAVVGAGAVVTKDVAPHTVVMGMPAKKVKDVSEVKEDKIELVDDLRKL